MRTKDAFALAFFIVLSEAAGIVGSLFTAPTVRGWYTTLARPLLSPPSWVFAPVWTTLYLLMGIAAFLVWRAQRHAHVRIALWLFALQLVLNALWSYLFFGLQSPGAGLIDIALLWAAILATLIAFWRVSRKAAWLLVPYLAWVTFAAYLNWMLFILNR